MAKGKKDNIIPQGKNSSSDQKKATAIALVFDKNSALRVNLAIGTVTLAISILLLYILNKLILSNYNPDIKAILDKVLPLSIQSAQSFAPEPVERMQFQLSLLCAPLFIFFTFILVNKKRKLFEEHLSGALFINIAGILALLTYMLTIFKQDLLYVPDETTRYFFANNAISQLNVLIALILYAVFAWLFFLYYNAKESTIKKTMTNIISYGIALFIIMDIVLYNIFHLAMQEWGRLMETNAVFYSVTQVYAGKSLLVDINAQYGLYAWVLYPLFKLIGLSTYKFGLVMAILNGISFLLIYLGIKRLIKQDVLSLIIFLTLTWWLYWQTRIPFESTARYYYQYDPIRILFPSLSFFLIVLYQSTTTKYKKIILPLLALSSSIAVFWNLDTGLVLYGATLIALLYEGIDIQDLKKSVKKWLVYGSFMIGALLLVIIAFVLSTKAHSGMSPEFTKFAAFQNVFYISGFFMLPMAAIHFWNLPVIVYLIACVYCVYQLKRAPLWDTPVVVFLFILGCGIFAYFQGRSYDMTLDAVMYPAIILLGVFCSKLIPDIQFKKGQFKFHEGVVLFFIAFLFFIDSAFSMLYKEPAIHSFAVDNAHAHNPEKENVVKERMDFLNNNLHPKDTVLILAQDYDSYYYASGMYYNPVRLPGSTEIFFKSEVDTLLNFIKTTKYPIVYDAMHPTPYSEAVVKALAQYTQVEKALPDNTMLLLRARKDALVQRLPPDPKTIYYNNAGDFNKYINPTTKIALPENYTIELYVTVDSSKLKKDNLLFSSASQTRQFSGVLMVQYGPDFNQYLFTYGNGSAWCSGVPCKLHTNTENHLIIKVEKNIIVVYNNNELCGQANTNSVIRNSDAPFFINPGFAGVVEELKIESE